MALEVGREAMTQAPEWSWGIMRRGPCSGGPFSVCLRTSQSGGAIKAE